jgi:hypothetical protein
MEGENVTHVVPGGCGTEHGRRGEAGRPVGMPMTECHAAARVLSITHLGLHVLVPWLQSPSDIGQMDPGC